MPRRKQGHCKPNATGGYLKKKTDSGTEIIENESIKPFTSNNDLVFKIKKTVSCTISNSYHEKIEREHIDASKSLNDINMVSKHEVNNNLVGFVREQDENSNNRNVLENFCCGSNYITSDNMKSSKNICTEGFWNRSLIISTENSSTLACDLMNSKCSISNSKKFPGDSVFQKSICNSSDSSSVTVITNNVSVSNRTSHSVSDVFASNSKSQNSESQYMYKKLTDALTEKQNPDLCHSQMSGVSPVIISNDRIHRKSDSQQMNYRLSTSITESKSNQAKDTIDTVMKEDQNYHLPSSVYGSPASSIEKVLTGLNMVDRDEGNESSGGKISFLQEILQNKVSETVSHDSLSRQLNLSPKNESEGDSKSQPMDISYFKLGNSISDMNSKSKTESSQPVKLKLHIPEVFNNEDSNSSVLSSESQKTLKIPQITSPQILEQHISKIISENAAIVETLDPKWSRRYFKQSSLNSSSSIDSDPKKVFPFKLNRSEDKSNITEGSKLQSALLGGAEVNAVNSSQKILISPTKTSLSNDKFSQYNNLPSTVPSVNMYSKIVSSVSEDELKGSAIKSLLSLKRGRYSKHKNSVFADNDIYNQHPQNPEGSIIKDLLLKSKLKEGSKLTDTDDKINLNSFAFDGNNLFYKSSRLKCPNCSSEFSEKCSLDIHLSFCKSATKQLFPLRDNADRITCNQINAQKPTDFRNNSSHISEDSDHSDSGGPILKKQLLLPLSRSPPMKRRKVSDSMLTSYQLEQSYGGLNHYNESSNFPTTPGSIAVLPHRSRSHSVHLFGGEVQIVDGDKTKRIKIKTSIPGAFTPSTNRFTDSFGIKKPEAIEELESDKDANNLPSVVVTIAQPVHNSGGTVHLPNSRSPSISPLVTIASCLSDSIVSYTKSDRSTDYSRIASQNEFKPFLHKEPSLLNLSNPSIAFLPGPDSQSFGTSGLPISASSKVDIKPGSFMAEISPITIRLPISPGNKPFYSPIFPTNDKSFEASVNYNKEKESQNNHTVPTVVFTPSSPTLPTSENDVQPANSTSISEPTKKFLAPTRPTSLPLKKKPFTMVGSTLISPETPRPKKTCIQLYLNGHAYTYLGLKCSTRSTYCSIYRPQPMFVLQETNPKLSMYSNWQVVPAKEELSGLTPGQMNSLYCSKQRKGKSITATAKVGEPLIFTHSSYWTYRSTEKPGTRKSVTDVADINSNETEDNKVLLETQDSIPEQTLSDFGNLSTGSKSSDPIQPREESNLCLDTDNTNSDGDVNNSDEDDDDDDFQDDGTESLTDSSQPQPPKRVKIFEGGFKSNEDYTYVRGRGRGKYVCEECGIRCKKPSMLKKHIRTHTDLRPYKCKHCSFAFKTKGNLTKHMKSKAHHKKCTELGIIPVPTTTDDSQIDEEALAKQEQIEKKTQFSDGEDADDDDDDTDETDDDCESDTSSMITSSSNSRMLTNGHTKKSGSQDKVDAENLDDNRGSESVSQHSEEQEAARSLLHLSAIGEPTQWSTSTGDLTDVTSSGETEMGLITRQPDQPLLSPQYASQTMSSAASPNIRTTKTVSDQWLPTESQGHRPRSYSADIPLGGGKEMLLKYKLIKGITSDTSEKATLNETEFGCRDQYTRRYSISVAREARKPRVIQPPEWNALGLPIATSKWPDMESADQPMDLSVSRDLSRYKSSYSGGSLLNIVTQEETVPDRHLQSPLELCLNEQYPMKTLNVLSPQVVDYDPNVDSSSEAPVLSLTDDQASFSSTSTASKPVYYMQDIAVGDNIIGRKDIETPEDPPSPDIDYSACSPVSPTTLEENAYYSQENMGHSSTGEEMQSSSRAHAEFIVPSSSTNMEEGKCVCRICNKIFAKSSHLRLHVNIHYFERPFRCDNCAVSFRTKGHLQKHKRSVSHYNKVNMNLTFGTPTVDNPRPFKCADCKIAFRIHGHLAKHLRSKMHIMKLECLGKLPFGMYAEMERSGVSLNEIDTTDCNNSLESLQVMAQKLYQRDPRRMRWQGPDQTAVETDCAMPGPSVASTLLEPILPITESLPTAFDPSCSGIGLALPSLATPKHLSESSDVKNEPSEVDPLRIPPAYSDGDSAISVSRYIVSQPIPTANQETSQRVEVPESDSSVSLNRSGTCHMCGRLFKSAKFLQVHLYSDHSSVITSVGDVPPSNSSVSSVASLEMNCDLCGRIFPNQKALQKHLLSHAQPRPFVCEVCDAGFTSSSSLISHQVTHQPTSSQSAVSDTRLVQLK